MIDLKSIRKYFTYDDKLRVIVSMVTGVLIILFNAISGFIIIYILFDLIFGINNTSFLTILFYSAWGIIVGAGVLTICILFIDLVLNGIEIEEYSYVRLVLLVSVVVYLLILFLYILFAFSTILEKKIDLNIFQY